MKCGFSKDTTAICIVSAGRPAGTQQPKGVNSRSLYNLLDVIVSKIDDPVFAGAVRLGSSSIVPMSLTIQRFIL